MDLDWAATYVRSERVRYVVHGTRALAYNTLLRSPTLLSARTVEFIHDLPRSFSLPEIRSMFGFTDGDLERVVRPLVRGYILLPGGADESLVLGRRAEINERQFADRKLVRPSLSVLLTRECNLRCTYCASRRVAASLARSDRSRLSADLTHVERSLVPFVRQAIENGEEEFHLGINGGEPLLFWNDLAPFLRRVADLEPRLKFRFFVKSNLTLLDEAVAGDFRDLSVTTYASVDGPGPAHDSGRVFINRRGTYRRVMRALELLRKKGVRCTSCVTVLHRGNVESIGPEFFDQLRELGFERTTIELDFFDLLPQGPWWIADRLLDLRRVAESRGLSVDGYWRRPFDTLLGPGPVGERFAFCGTFEGRQLCLQPDGGAFPCSYVPVPVSDRGDLLETVTSGEYMAFVKRRWVGNIEGCRSCEIEGLCMGGCYAILHYFRNILATDLDRVYRDYYCPIYRRVTSGLILEHLAALPSRGSPSPRAPDLGP